MEMAQNLLDDSKQTHGFWTEKEDECLLESIEEVGGSWNEIAEHMKTKNIYKTGKQCRERYLNYLLAKPREKITLNKSEEDILFLNYNLLGPQWVKIADDILKKTENVVKNAFYANLRRVFRFLDNKCKEIGYKRSKLTFEFVKQVAGTLNILINDIPDVPEQYLNGALKTIQNENKLKKHNIVSNNPKKNIHSPLNVYNNESEEEVKEPKMKLRFRKEEKIEKEMKVNALKPTKNVNKRPTSEKQKLIKSKKRLPSIEKEITHFSLITRKLPITDEMKLKNLQYKTKIGISGNICKTKRLESENLLNFNLLGDQINQDIIERNVQGQIQNPPPSETIHVGAKECIQKKGLAS